MIPKTTATTTPVKEPAKVLSPAELAEELMGLAGDCISWELEDELRDAKAELAAVQAKVGRAGEKKLRILRAKSIEEAQAILDENPADVNLKQLCQRRSGWKPLQEKGASDQQLKEFLNKQDKGGWPYSRPYPHKIPSAEVDYRGAQVWVDPDKGAEGNAHLSGQKLVDAVRRVMGIPKKPAPLVKEDAPVGAAKKKSAPKKAPAKKPTPKAPATSSKTAEPDAGDVDEPAGAAKVMYAAAAGVTEQQISNASIVGRLAYGYQNERKGTPTVPPLSIDGQTWVVTGQSWSSDGNYADALPLYTPANFFAKFGVKYKEISGYTGQSVKVRGSKFLIGPKSESIRITWTDQGARPIVQRTPGQRPLTWGQWSATLRGIRNAIELDANLPTKANPTADEAYFLDMFRKGVRPSDARDAWEAKTLLEGRRDGDSGAPAASPKPVLASVAALSKPQTPMPEPDGDGTPRKPDRQSLTWHQWRPRFASSYHKLGERAGIAHESVGEEDFEPKGLLLDLYNRGLKPVVAAAEYVEHLRDHAGGEGNDSPDAAAAAAKPSNKDVRIGGLTWRRQPNGEWWATNTAGVEGHPDVLQEFVVHQDHGGTGWSVEASDKELLPERLIDHPDLFATENDAKAWCERRNAELLRTAKAPAADTWDDPNVDGRGVFVEGVDEVWVRGEAKNDKAKIVIRVARGADGMYRTGHLLEFVGAQAWQADSDEPVRISGQALELEHYAVKARAHILINVIKAAPGGDGRGGAWSAVQRATYNAAIKALEVFIAHHAACQPATTSAKLKRPKAAIA